MMNDEIFCNWYMSLELYMSCPARKFKMKNLQRAVADLSIVVPVKEVK